MLKVVVLLIALRTCGAVIDHLNESEYARLPPLFYLDPYEECIQQGGEYCSLRMSLVSDQPSSLLNIIEQYSAHRAHFNHKILNRGICINKTCKNSQANTTRDLRNSVEGCLNRTLWKDYRLKAKLTEAPSCYKQGEQRAVKNERISILDVTIAVLLGAVLMLNLVGSLREFTVSEKDDSVWSCFSVQHNWRALTRPSVGADPRREGMKAFNGIRSLSSMLVIGTHALLPFVIGSDNPRAWEEGYKYMKYVSTGALIIQTFFTMSGFLMAYSLAAGERPAGDGCRRVLRRVLLRWLRLAPPYLIVLALMMTWLRFVGAGPMWQTAVGDHLEACRRHWWLVPLNIINYIDHSQCFIEYWYIAADMQLSILGLLVVGMLRGRARWCTLGFLLVAGLIVAAAQTWVQDLDGWMLLIPESSRTFFMHDATFNKVYKRGHTNVPAYVIGAAAGLLVCGWQRDCAVKKHHDTLRRCRFIYWLTVPLMVGTVAAGSVFVDAPAALPLRVAYSALGRAVFGGCVALLLAGLTVKIEGVYRGALAWRGWTRPARLSYCAYAVHVPLLRLYTGAQHSLAHVSLTNCVCVALGGVLAAFVAAAPLWLLVEAPAAALVRRLARAGADCRDTPAADACEGNHTDNPIDRNKHVVAKL